MEQLAQEINPFTGFRGASPEAVKFVECFAYLTPRDAKVKRKQEWKALDGNANNYVSLTELDIWIKVKLCDKYKAEGTPLWKAFRPSYICAMSEAKGINPGEKIKGTNATTDDYIEWSEFRLACAFLCAAALMYDAFARVDGRGPGAIAGGQAEQADHRIERAEWMSGYTALHDTGFVALANLDKARAEGIFGEIDRDGRGMVLLNEWCLYLKKTEEAAATELGQIMLHEDPVGFKVKQVFKRYDTNGDMRLSLDELKRMVRAEQSDSSDADCELLFKHIDKDNNGSISFEEFYGSIFDEN